MERKIGETFEYEGKTLRVTETKSYLCTGCFFNGNCVRSEAVGHCKSTYRTDKKNIVFMEVKKQSQETEEIKERKIGEVFEYEGEKLKVVISGSKCDGCYFKGKLCDNDNINRDITGICGWDRKDNKYVKFIKVTEGQQDEQPQKLNLCDVLKYCLQGETFWSPMFGDLKFNGINKERNFINIKLESGETWNINADGTISLGTTTSPEIMLYPSREQRDWTKVKYEPKKEKFDPKTLKPFDRVLSKYDGGCWSANLFSHIEERDNEYCAPFSVCNGSLVKFCIPYNDDTKHLVGTKDEAPEFYRYWED